MTENNSYSIFLQENEELPRLSILDNYKSVNRIMTSSYLKSFKDEILFRSEKNSYNDPYFVKYQEERINTLKMSTILKTINSPRNKRKTISDLRKKAIDAGRIDIVPKR